jgi:hypothetical protein
VPVNHYNCFYFGVTDWFTIGFGTWRSRCTYTLIDGPLCPISIHVSPVTLLKLQLAPRPRCLSSGSKEEPRCTCLGEVTASHSQTMWAEISFSAPRLLHNGLNNSAYLMWFVLIIYLPCFYLCGLISVAFCSWLLNQHINKGELNWTVKDFTGASNSKSSLTYIKFRKIIIRN